jgi:hypothetical protein
MKIIAFLERHQTEVIEKILRHCGLWEESDHREPKRGRQAERTSRTTKRGAQSNVMGGLNLGFRSPTTGHLNHEKPQHDTAEARRFAERDLAGYPQTATNCGSLCKQLARNPLPIQKPQVKGAFTSGISFRSIPPSLLSVSTIGFVEQMIQPLLLCGERRSWSRRPRMSRCCKRREFLPGKQRA